MAESPLSQQLHTNNTSLNVSPCIKEMSEDYKRLMDELIKARDLIENSLRQSIRELEEMGIGPNDSLIDAEGFPRVDIDLYRVRSLRSSISSTKSRLL